MILNVKRFNSAIKKSGQTMEALASGIDRPGFNPMAALQNWTRGNFKPAPKPDDITKLANALGVSLNEIASYRSSHRFARVAARKVRLVTDLIQGRDIDSALSVLRFNKKRAAVFVRHILDSAIASAEENNADITRLVVCESRVDEGVTIKRFQPKDRGRAHQILKRTSHIIVAVEEAGN